MRPADSSTPRGSSRRSALGMFYRRFPDPGSEMNARFRAGSTDVWRVEAGLHGPRLAGAERRRDVGPPRRSDIRGHRRPAGSTRPTSRRATAATSTRSRRCGPRRAPVRLVPAARRRRGAQLRLERRARRPVGRGRVRRAARDVRRPRRAEPVHRSRRRCPGFYGGRRLLYQRARVALDLRPGGRDRSGVEIGLDGTYVQGIIDDPQPSRADGVRRGRRDRRHRSRAAAEVRGRRGPAGRACARPVRRDDLADRARLWNRGLPDGLLRDRSGVAGTAEYRWLISSAHRRRAVRRRERGGQRLVRGPRARRLPHQVGVGLRFYRRGHPRYWEDAPERRPAGRVFARPGRPYSADRRGILSARELERAALRPGARGRIC